MAVGEDCVAVALIVGTTVGVGVVSKVAVGIRASAGVGVVSIVGGIEGSGVGASVFVAETVGVTSCNVLLEERSEDDLSPAALLPYLPTEVDDRLSFSVLDADIAAVAMVGARALNNITAINRARQAISILGFNVIMMSPIYLQAGEVSRWCFDGLSESVHKIPNCLLSIFRNFAK